MKTYWFQVFAKHENQCFVVLTTLYLVGFMDGLGSVGLAGADQVQGWSDCFSGYC